MLLSTFFQNSLIIYIAFFTFIFLELLVSFGTSYDFFFRDPEWTGRRAGIQHFVTE